MPEQFLAPRYLSFASVLDDAAKQQLTETASMPFVYPHLASMPDVHLGKGCAVGTVLPTERAIIPAAVGVDIGCGMIAVRTGYTADDLPGSLRPLRERIESSIPLSAGNYNTRMWGEATVQRIAQLEREAEAAAFDPDRYVGTWRLQLGTLGSGNHFIEVSLDEEDRVWLFLHSGSRGIGNKIAQHHIKVAADLNRKWHIRLPNPDLAYLVEDTDEFRWYIGELRWAQHFALLNREEMMDRLIHAFEETVGGPVNEAERINCHHNYTEQEKHRGRTVWLSRKGAINAAKGVRGLIPGSMGTRSYVVTGLGYEPSLNSAPHGAGREYSRNAARKAFTHEQLREAMVGIEYRDTDAFIDEIPQAYKDIDVVMQDAAKLVRVDHTLRQILNVKGD
jgi:tRNA-splicing ligase RtcB